MHYFSPQPSDHEDPWVSTTSFLREKGKKQKLPELGTRLCATFTVGLSSQRDPLWLEAGLLSPRDSPILQSTPALH